MKAYSYLTMLVLLLTSLLTVYAAEQTKQTEKAAPKKQMETKKVQQRLYIGMQKNRLPYSGLDKEQRPQGLLIHRINKLCEAINAECKFVMGEFDQLVHDLQTYQLNALIVIDAFLLVKLDKLQLTPALCTSPSLFAQKKGEPPRIEKDDFKNSTIGVLRGSLQHFYLLDHYSSHASLKSYPLLESGVFDLYSGRIDALLTDETFFKARVEQTPLSHDSRFATLIAIQPKEAIKLPAKMSMTLALREKDTELHTQFTAALKAQGETPSCMDLLPTPNPTSSENTPEDNTKSKSDSPSATKSETNNDANTNKTTQPTQTPSKND